MQSEHQHIDDFFRKKEEEYQHDTGGAGIQWERMRGLLTAPVPPAPKGFRLLSTRRIIKYLGGFTVVTVITLVSITTIRSNRKATASRATATTATPKTAATPRPVKATASTPATTITAAAGNVKASAPSPVTTTAGKYTGTTTTGNIGSRTTSATNIVRTGSHSKKGTATQPRIYSQPSSRSGGAAPRQVQAHLNSDQSPNGAVTLPLPPAPTPATTTAVILTGSEAAPTGNNDAVVDLQAGATTIATPAVAAAKINAFYKALQKPNNVFTVDVEQEAVLNGREGTRLIIPPHSFATSTGILKNQLVTVVLEEYYTYEDMLAAKLTTTSGEDQLISNGMVKLTAHSNGKPVNIAYRKTIQLEMPAPRFDPEMQLFRGTRSSLKEGHRAAFVGNRMIDTVHFKKLEADENGDIDWIPEGQLQSARKTNLLDRNIVVFNPYGDPYKVSRGRKIKAYIYLSKKCPLSDRKMAKLIINHSNGYFDKVKFKRVDAVPVANYRYMEDRASIAGDSMQMTFRQALRKKLLSPADSLSILERLRADSTHLAGTPENRNKYRFDISSLGYFNCDKFNRQPDNTPNVLFAFNPGEGFERSSMVTHLVFTRYKSVIKGSYKGDKINFGRIPKNEPVKVLCLGVKNGQVMACIRDLNTSEGEIANLAFTATTPEEFKQQLQAVSAALP